MLCGFQLESGETLDVDSTAPHPPPSKKKRKNGKVNTGTKKEIRIREEHTGKERSLRGAGTLQLAGGTILFLSGVLSMFADFKPNGAEDLPEGIKLIGAIIAALGFLSALVGWGIRRLKSWSRLPFILLNLFGLLGFPVGTIISGYCLYLILGENGKYLLSTEYGKIVERTQGVKAKTSILVWLILAALVGFVLPAAAAVMSR